MEPTSTTTSKVVNSRGRRARRLGACRTGGGKDGKTGGVYLNGKSIDQPKRVIDVNEDDWLELRLPGGGGFG
ncbi:MAG: hypothetical protein EBV84_02260 [Betaproteobacteria bacterium]|nr:hypothetical protein [Betaproteobacteria bacterium]